MFGDFSIFRNDYVRVNTGRIGTVLDVVNITKYDGDRVVGKDYMIFTDLRKAPYHIDEIIDAASDKRTLRANLTKEA